MRLTVKEHNAKPYPTDVDVDMSVADLKAILADDANLPSPSHLRIVCKGRVLRDDDTLKEAGVAHGDGIHISLLSSPLMSGLLENPEALRAMMMANPQMRQMMECNPELGHILNDPAVLRQSIETTRNPELRREQQRNTDRAISNIEMMPEGFNMLRRMYSTYQQPLDSVSPSCFMSSASAGGGHTAASPPAQASPNTSALPNPWQPQPQQPVAPTYQAPPANWMATPPGATQIPIQSTLPPRQQQTPNPPSQQQPASSVAQAQQILQQPAALAGALTTDPASQALLSANPEMAGFLGRPEFLQRLATNVAQANGMAAGAGAGASPPVQATTSSACSHVGPRPADAADASKACKGGCGFFRSAGSEYCSKCKP